MDLIANRIVSFSCAKLIAAVTPKVREIFALI